MIQKLFAGLIVLIGIIILIVPFASGEKAYFIGDSYYINMQDSVDLQYKPYLKSLIQKEQLALAFHEKKKLREQLKGKGDSLETALINAKEKKQNTIIEQINIAKNELQLEIVEKETAIDDKYQASNLPKETFEEKLKQLESKISKNDYVLTVANEMINMSGDPTIPKVTEKDLHIQTVNQQNKKAFVISGLFILLAGIYLFFVQSNQIPLYDKKYKMISIVLLSGACLYLAFLSYETFATRLEFDRIFKSREAEVKNKLNDIKTLQIAYFEAKNSYCKSWDELKDFAKNDSIKISKHLVNKDDTAAVRIAKNNGLKLEEISYVPVLNYAFPDQKIDINAINKIPFSEENFELNAGKIFRNGRDVHVFEVRTSKYTFVKNLESLPENFDKTVALVLGSMTEPTTEGNW